MNYLKPTKQYTCAYFLKQVIFYLNNCIKPISASANIDHKAVSADFIVNVYTELLNYTFDVGFTNQGPDSSGDEIKLNRFILYLRIPSTCVERVIY